ncbi:MAG: CPBP family intramembrane glutamic endopeptidase [Planctomycetota bacterium]|nr:CPBP family intramembrane glutamic endopeptidase [Planctomycetota bacterium]
MDNFVLVSFLLTEMMCFCLFVLPPWVTLFLTRIRKGIPLIKNWPSVHPRLDLIDVIVTFAAYLGSQILATFLVLDWPSTGNDFSVNPLLMSPLNSSAGIGMLGGTTIAMTLVFCRRGDFRSMRIRFDNLPRQFTLGLVCAFCILPAIFMLNLFVSFSLVEYSHPVIETFLSEMSLSTLISTAFTVIIAAPLVEEFVFRGVLLTFLHRALQRSWESDTIFWCSNRAQPVRPPADGWLSEHGAIIITSVLFAALHVGQGAAYIPLFFLALALGYVTNRTGSIWPAVTIHMTLNGISTMPLVMTYLQATG